MSAVPQLLAMPPDLQGLQKGAGVSQLRWGAVAEAYEVRLWQAWADPATQSQHTPWVTLAATGTTSLETGPDTHAPLTLTRTAAGLSLSSLLASPASAQP